MILCGEKKVGKGDREGEVVGSSPGRTLGDRQKQLSITKKHSYVTINDRSYFRRGPFLRLERHHLITFTHITDRWQGKQQQHHMVSIHTHIYFHTLYDICDVQSMIKFIHISVCNFRPECVPICAYKMSYTYLCHRYIGLYAWTYDLLRLHQRWLTGYYLCGGLIQQTLLYQVKLGDSRGLVEIL